MEPLITNIRQVALVVNDLPKAAAVFAEGFGLELLNVRFGYVEGDENFKENTISIKDVYLEGEPIGTYGIEMAAVNFENAAQLEIICPGGNRSLFRDYLEQYGPSIQHIAIDSGYPFHETMGRMAAAGNPLGQRADVDDGQEECTFVKHRAFLGIDIELYNRLSDFRLPEITPNFIKPDKTVTPKPLIRRIAGLNIVTNDMQPTLTMLKERYGMEKWEIEEATDQKPSLHARYKEAGVELQLLEPRDDTSYAVPILKRHGGTCGCSIEFECDATMGEIEEALKRIGRTPQPMYDNKIAADFTDLFGAGLIFRAEK